jgi:hypothetical protein
MFNNEEIEKKTYKKVNIEIDFEELSDIIDEVLFEMKSW